MRKVLVLFAAEDEAFARGYLAPALGLADHDTSAGLLLGGAALAKQPVSELARLVATSEIVVPVMSPSFLADPWLRLSEGLASHAAVGERGPSVVMLKLRACEPPLYQEMQVALDCTDEGRWAEQAARLRQHAAQPAPVRDEDAPRPCPYPGMRPYRGAEAAFFYGRQREMDEVLRRLDEGVRELYVIGPSGSGKSSLMAAGVLPRLLARAGKRFVRILRPGAAPNAALAEALGGGADVEAGLAALLLGEPEAQVVVVIDQAEELFSLSSPSSGEELRRFGEHVKRLRAEPRCTLFFTIRADFYAELLQSDLWAEGSRQHLGLTPMRREELRVAIEEPARQVGVFLEPALLDGLLRDADDQPSALPLLQETMVQLWERRRYQLLSLAAYREMGGLAKALSQRADHVLGELAAPQAELARRTFLRLVAFGEGRPHTRRRLPMSALRGGEQAALLDEVIATLAASRLLVLSAPEGGSLGGGAAGGEDLVDLCHDVLIVAWPAFSGWVEDRRVDEQRRRQLQAQAESWRARGGGSAGLLDEGELAAARSWRETAAARELGESADVTALVAASAEALDGARRGRRWRLAIGFAVLAGFTVLALLLASRATRSAREATQRGDEARASAARAEAQRRRSEELLARQYQDAGRRWIVEGKPQRAVPYLVAARELDAARGAGEERAPQRIRRMLFRAATGATVRASFQTSGVLLSLSYSDGEDVIVTGSADGVVQRFRAATGEPIGPPMRHPAAAAVQDISADGTRLLTVCDDGVPRLWELGGGAPVVRAFAHPGKAFIARFTRDAQIVVTGGDDGTLQRWEASTGRSAGAPIATGEPIVRAALSPDGSQIAVFHLASPAVSLWSLRGAPAEIALATQSSSSGVTGVEFSADGSRVAVTRDPYVVAEINDTKTGALLSQVNLNEPVRLVYRAPHAPRGFLVMGAHTVVWSDGTRSRTLPSTTKQGGMILDSGGTSFLLWNVQADFELRRASDGALISRIEGSIAAKLALLGREGHEMVIGSEQGVVRIWRLFYDAGAREPDKKEGEVLRAAPSLLGPARLLWPIGVRKESVTFSPDGRYAVTLAEDTLRLYLWSTASPAVRTVLAHEKMINGAALSPDSSHLATFGRDGMLKVWELRTARLLYDLKHRDHVGAVRFSPDGASFLSVSDGVAQLWETESGAPLLPEITHREERAEEKLVYPTSPAQAGELIERRFKSDRVLSAGFSRDGRRIISRSADGRIRSTDISLDDGTLEEWRRVAALGLFGPVAVGAH